MFETLKCDCDILLGKNEKQRTVNNLNHLSLYTNAIPEPWPELQIHYKYMMWNIMEEWERKTLHLARIKWYPGYTDIRLCEPQGGQSRSVSSWPWDFRVSTHISYSFITLEHLMTIIDWLSEILMVFMTFVSFYFLAKGPKIITWVKSGLSLNAILYISL